jgi:L-rhamnose mutarotase
MSDGGTPVRRVAAVIGLPAENADEYERLHTEVPDAVVARLRASNVRDYSIHRYGELLFSRFTYVGDDYDADMAAIAADPATQRWWALCEPLQRPVDGRAAGEWWHDLPEVFFSE